MEQINMYPGISAISTNKSFEKQPRAVAIEGEELVKAKGIKVVNYLKEEDLKKISFSFIKNYEGKLCIEFIEVLHRDDMGFSQGHYEWLIGKDVTRFKLEKVSCLKNDGKNESAIYLTIEYTNNTSTSVSLWQSNPQRWGKDREMDILKSLIR